MSLFKSQYYDKPDGEDYVGKMFATTRMMGAAALTIGKEPRIEFSWTLQ